MALQVEVSTDVKWLEGIIMVFAPLGQEGKLPLLLRHYTVAVVLVAVVAAAGVALLSSSCCWFVGRCIVVVCLFCVSQLAGQTQSTVLRKFHMRISSNGNNKSSCKQLPMEPLQIGKVAWCMPKHAQNPTNSILLSV